MQVLAFLFVFSWIIRSLCYLIVYLIEIVIQSFLVMVIFGHFHFSIIFDFGRL